MTATRPVRPGSCPCQPCPRPRRVCDWSTKAGPELEQPAFPSTVHGGCPRLGVELGEDALGVGAERVERDVELARDLWSCEFTVEQPEHVELAPAQRFRQRRRGLGR